MATATEQLTQVWELPGSVVTEIASVDHKLIGIRYLLTAFGFFGLAGLLAVVMRLQLSWSENELLQPDTYNQFFTMHGTAMIFLFITPMLSGFGNYMIPLMIGARDMAFPRLNALGYWIFLLSGLFMFSSMLFGVAPDAGWFNYVPLTGTDYSPGLNIDFYALGLIFLGISTTAGAINFIVTIFKLRAPGMSLNRVPLFCWTVLVTSFAIIFAIPSLTGANLLLELERKFGMHFYDPTFGGDALLWQHLFWVFGHPDVYIIFLPAVGIVSEITQTFSRRPIVGYTFMVLAAVATGIIGFGVWVHHMFATGLPLLSMTFFAAASLLITIPSGIQIFGWLATLWTGRPQLYSPLLFVLGFIILFVIGGVTGVMFAAFPFDQQITDSYFVVAHFHYVLFGGAVFPVFAALHYWFPKITGRMLNEKLGQVTFWLMFIGFNLAFFPMHIMGLLGMPRRIYTYLPGMGWEWLNLLSTAGGFILAGGILLFILNALWSRQGGAVAGDNPWEAPTLEWSITSPPPKYNFGELPEVQSRLPLWTDPGLSVRTQALPKNVEVLTEGHEETLGTTVLTATPEQILEMPGDSHWPLFLGISLLFVFIGLLLDITWLAVLAGLATLLVIAAWLWPDEATDTRTPISTDRDLPVNMTGHSALGWWGMTLFIATEAALFAVLLGSYFYLWISNDTWPLAGIRPPDLFLPALNTTFLIASSFIFVWAENQIRANHQGRFRLGLLLVSGLGLLFLGIQAWEYSQSTFTPQTNAYGSLFFTITGFHGLHLVVGLLMLAYVQVRAWLRHFNREYYLAVQTTGLYWHFVDIVWLFVFVSLYFAPNLP